MKKESFQNRADGVEVFISRLVKLEQDLNSIAIFNTISYRVFLPHVCVILSSTTCYVFLLYVCIAATAITFCCILYYLYYYYAIIYLYYLYYITLLLLLLALILSSGVFCTTKVFCTAIGSHPIHMYVQVYLNI